MANPEWDNYDPNKRNCLTAKKEDKAMQDLTHYYKNIITLKSGVQIEILTKLPWEKADKSCVGWTIIHGFIKTPLLVEKDMEVLQEEIAAIESIKNPCIAQVIPWPESEDKYGKIISEVSVSVDQVEERDGLIQRKKHKPMGEHKSTCAFILATEAGKTFSEVIQCDCGAIVRCDDNKHSPDCNCTECHYKEHPIFEAGRG